MSLNDIQKVIQNEMELFEVKFRESMRTKVVLLDKIMSYIVNRKGKQMRPMFVFFAANLQGQTSEATYRGAALIELLHTATLVHDDVVDDANYRRGFFSVNALWKNKIAVLVGDYLLSKGLLLAIDNEDFNLLKIVSKAVREMSEGELLQIEKARSLDLTEEVYYEVIRKKTASLIASCCAVGFASSGADDKTIEKAWVLGESIGMAFQIKDDLFDYGDGGIGKPVGIDIKEKKMTLPLLFALKKTNTTEASRIRRIIKNESHKPAKVKEVVSFVKQSGGLDYATDKMNEFYNQALEILNEFPETVYKQKFKELIDYTIQRKK